MSTFAAARLATGKQRPGHNHGCKPVEVVAGVWTAHFHDIETAETLKAVSSSIKTVVNSATDKCNTKPGSYGDDIDVLVVEGLLDDPEPRKKVDAMAEGPEKEAAKAALPAFPDCECAGDAKKDFERVNEAIDASKAAGGAAMVHCYASLSRSAAFVLAYMMKTQRITLVEAIKQMRKKWDATWPNDKFLNQLLEYEKELGLAGEPGVVEMKVTTKKSINFYKNAAKSFLQGSEDKDGNKKEPARVLTISGLGDAINTAVFAATAMETDGLGIVKKVETSYPDMDQGSAKHGCARIAITLYKSG
jgi:protein-tyrosine phosphatase